jgi:hypothetical protein
MEAGIIKSNPVFYNPYTLAPQRPASRVPIPLTTARFTSTIQVMNQTFKNVALSLAVILLVALLCLMGYIIAAGLWAFFLNA